MLVNTNFINNGSLIITNIPQECKALIIGGISGVEERKMRKYIMILFSFLSFFTKPKTDLKCNSIHLKKAFIIDV